MRCEQRDRALRVGLVDALAVGKVGHAGRHIPRFVCQRDRRLLGSARHVVLTDGGDAGVEVYAQLIVHHADIIAHIPIQQLSRMEGLHAVGYGGPLQLLQHGESGVIETSRVLVPLIHPDFRYDPVFRNGIRVNVRFAAVDGGDRKLIHAFAVAERVKPGADVGGVDRPGDAAHILLIADLGFHGIRAFLQ